MKREEVIVKIHLTNPNSVRKLKVKQKNYLELKLQLSQLLCFKEFVSKMASIIKKS